MPPSNSDFPTEDFFNDFSRRVQETAREQPGSPKNTNPDGTSNIEIENSVPRTKRIACIVCRKRKLKCDSTKPRCGTCARLGHPCAYDAVRKKSGPKRGYVKHLEARLAQVETLLKTQDAPGAVESSHPMSSMPSANFSDVPGMVQASEPAGGLPPLVPRTGVLDPQMNTMMDNLGLASHETIAWELISLGLEEPLPSQEIIHDMHETYFQKVHPSLPIIHRPRYLAAMDLAPNLGPPICLRYAVWTHVCSITPKYSALTDHFYCRARKYVEQDEMRGFGEGIVSVAHAQCWSLIAAYEFKMMYFPRAWMSVGRASRLAQMMTLNRLDGAALDVKHTIPLPRDWTEREERRRTFWLAFCQDRYASVGTGWPMTIDEMDISTNLPATEEAFVMSKPEKTRPLAEVMNPDGASTLSPFGGVILMACLFGRNLTHLHRPDTQDNDHDLNGGFWRRHRELDNILLNTSLSLPQQLRLPTGINDANVVFLNMNLHASTICLHQAAIFKADKNAMPQQHSGESKRRCMIAAEQIANTMKLVSHMDLATMNPFVAFCLYVAARVFVQYLKTHKDDAAVISSLQFVLAAMQALKAKNPLTESFLVQLDMDLEASGLRVPATNGQPSIRLPVLSDKSMYIPRSVDENDCIPLFDIREAQGEILATEAPTRPAFPKVSPGHPVEVPRMPATQWQTHKDSLLQRSTDPGRSPARASMSAGLSSAYEERSGLMDMDMSFEDRSNQTFPSHPNSGHPTPSISPHNSSSRTSFSPPIPDDHPSLTSTSSLAGMSPGNGSTTAAFNNQQAFPSFVPNPADFAKVPGSHAVQNPVVLPAAWDYDGGGQIVGNMAEHFKLTGIPSEDASSWQPMSVVQENEWLFQNWNGRDTST